jgi:hypothetical protein
MCRAQCLLTSCQKQLGRTSSGRTRGRLKLIEIELKRFSNSLETGTSRQTGDGRATGLDKRGSPKF